MSSSKKPKNADSRKLSRDERLEEALKWVNKHHGKTLQKLADHKENDR